MHVFNPASPEDEIRSRGPNIASGVTNVDDRTGW